MNEQLKAAQLELAKRELAKRQSAQGPSMLTSAAKSVPGQAITGAIEALGGFGYGVAETAADVAGYTAGKLWMPGVQKKAQDVASAISGVRERGVAALPTPETKSQEFARGAGKIGGEVATLAAVPTATGERLLAKGATMIPKLAEKGAQLEKAGTIGKIAVGAGKALPAGVTQAGLGYTYGRGLGETPEKASETAVGFGVLGSAVKGAESALREFGITANPKKVGESVVKALGLKQIAGAGDIGTTVEKSTKALKDIYDKYKGKTVVDLNGVEKPFEPTKANFFETAQALSGSMADAYKKYSDIAKSTGDVGASMGQKEAKSIVNSLESLIQPRGKLSHQTNAVKKVIDDFNYDFGTFNKADGSFYYKNATLDDYQKFVEKINTGVNPQSEAGRALANGYASKIVRDAMDSKIESATGAQYQAARNEFSNLKSIEKSIIDSVKKTAGASKTGISYLEGIGTIEALTGLAMGDIRHAAKMGAVGLFGKISRQLRDPEVHLRRVFQSFEPKATAPTKAQMAGKAAKLGTQALIGGITQ